MVNSKMKVALRALRCKAGISGALCAIPGSTVAQEQHIVVELYTVATVYPRFEEPFMVNQ